MRAIVFRLLAAFVAVSFVNVASIEAQQPVVFVHGLASNGSTWDEAAPYVSEKLDVITFQPSQSWWQPYEHQAAELQWQVGDLPSWTIALGHSNGGVVSREWSKLHPLGAVVTLGTPHMGAPIVDHIYDWLAFNNAGAYYDSQVVSAFSTPHNRHLDWLLSALLGDSLAWGRWFRGFLAWQSLAVLGLDLGLPVFNEMRAPSNYNQELNGVANLIRETGAIGARVGIADVPANFAFGGPLRLLVPPEYADDAALALHVAASSLYYWGAYVQGNVDTSDPFGVLDAGDKANWMMTLGQWLNSIDLVWCSLVSSSGPISASACRPNDSIVPLDSQLYPGAHSNLIVQGVPHTFETHRSNDVIGYVLHSMLGVPERPAPAPPPPPEPEPPPPPESGPPEHPHGYDILEPDEPLYPDQARQSNNGRFILLYQQDGNLVIYRDDWRPIWATGTNGNSPGMALMQSDGNFVVLDADGHCVWASNTWGNGGAYLDMQDDGNLVVYTAYLQPIWASNTSGY